MMDFASTLESGTLKGRAEVLTDVGLASVAACTALYAVTSLALPFGWDHAIIASVGSSYANGGLPYVDSWDMKGPAAYIPFALAQILFGSTMWGIRLLDVLIWAVAGFVLYQGVRGLTTWRIGVGAALATYLCIASSGWFFTAAPESWVTASCVLAIVPMLSSGANLKPRTVALSGFLIACAGLVKPFYFAFGLAPLISVAFSADLSLWRRAKLAFALAFGATVSVTLICGYFAVRGGLSQAIEVHILYPISTYLDAVTGWSVAIRGVAGFFRAPAILITTPFALLAVWFYRSQKRTLAILLAWLGVASICVAAQGKYWVYHWFPVYPPLFILGALGAFALIRTERRPGGFSLLVVVCSALVLVALVKRPLRDVAIPFFNSVLKHDSKGYYSSYDFRLYNASDEIAAARYIAAHTDPQQKVFVWGSDALYYLANRPNASRFTFLMPLTMPGPYRANYRTEAMRELMDHPPTYFVTGIAWDGLSKAATELADFPAMANFLDQHYSLEKTIGVLDLYRLREQASSTSADVRSQAVNASGDIGLRFAPPYYVRWTGKF
jgi:hypothetical protein